MKLVPSLAFTAALALLASTAGAQTPSLSRENEADVQCFVVFSIVSSQFAEDSPEQAGFSGAVMYHLGRLEGRQPGVDWLARIGTYLETVSDTVVQDHGERCAASLAERGQAMVTWGEKLQGQ